MHGIKRRDLSLYEREPADCLSRLLLTNSVDDARAVFCQDKTQIMLDETSMSGDRVPPFRERPPWLGADLQTLRNLICGGPPELSGGERLLLRMPDGDRLAARLDRPTDLVAAPLVVLVHGLAGSEASRHGVAATRYLVDQGWPVLRLNLRGSLPSRPTSAGRYHAGKTEDLAEALRPLPPDLTQ